MNSRLFVQNLPKKITEKALREHFSKFGVISDLKLVSREQTNRRFCFLGFKSEEDAKKTKEYFDKTYVMTSKISIDYAKTKDDPLLNSNKPQEEVKEILKERTKKAGLSNADALAEIDESKKKKFNEFMSIMKAKQGSTWKDVVDGENEEEPKKKRKLSSNNDKMEEENPLQKEQPQEIVKEAQNEIGKRLFVLNLAYDSTEDDVRGIFQRFGEITEIKMPLDKEKKFRGFAYVTFSQDTEALHCFSELDNAIVQGRILHIKPAEGKPQEDKNKPEFSEKSSFKTFSKERRLAKLGDTRTWNTLFLNPNCIVNEICSRFEVKKVDLFSVEQDNLAAKIALAESKLIAETIEWMKIQGMDLAFMDSSRAEAERSKRVIIVKNLHTKADTSSLSELFSRFGKVEKTLVAPNGAIGIVVMDNDGHAANAFQNLSYFVYKHEPLYLEYAPLGMIEEPEAFQREEILEEEDTKAKILFVKNLNFITDEPTLEGKFSRFGEIMKVKIPKDSDGKSKGFGFVEFRSKSSVSEALKKCQGEIVDSHCLQLSVSIPKEAPVDKRKKKVVLEVSTKLLVKNLAFEATRKELTELLKQFGEVKTVRMPKKLDNTHRSFLCL